MSHDVSLEQALIGFALLNNAAIPTMSDRLKPEDFSEPLHRDLWQICSNMAAMGKKVSPLTATAFLPTDLKVGDMPIKQYLVRLAAESALPGEAMAIVDAIRDMADRRSVTEIGLVMRDSKDGAGELAAWAIEELDKIASARIVSGVPAVDMRAAVVRAIDATAHAYQHDGKVRGMSYGLRALDDKTLGAQPGHLIVIAGRPGMGKTALALAITRNIAEQGSPVWFYSAEMGDVDLTTRMLADRMWQPGKRMTYWQIASGKYHESVFERIADAGKLLAELPIKIEQEPGLTVSQIASRARQHKRRYGLKAMVVDHLGLVKASGRYAGNKVYETGEITQALKGLAKELEVPVFLLAQINRGVEQREDKRPTLADLRNSGDIEQDADTVMILYREAYYLAKREPHPSSAEFLIWSGEMDKVQNRLDVYIEKQRAGPVGLVRLFCDIACNVVRDEVSEMDDSRVDYSEAKDLVG